MAAHFLTILFIITTLFPRALPHRYTKHVSVPPPHNSEPQQYIELTRPLATDHATPTCTRHLLHHNFSNTYNLPPTTAPYSPLPNCTWSRAVLHLHATCKGNQYDRIAGVWLDGVEILRTSTPEPTEDGVFWKVTKDVTRYKSILLDDEVNHTLAVMLENIVNDEFTGVYHVNVSMSFYDDNVVVVEPKSFAVESKLGLGSDDSERNRDVLCGEGIEKKLGLTLGDFVRNRGVVRGNRKLLSLYGDKNELELDCAKKQVAQDVYETPADLIIPISRNGDGEIWFRIENDKDMHEKGVQIPSNTWKAVLEVYVSFHGNDEFWYMNPPDSYVRMNNLTTGRAHGAYREVLVTIDGKLVGSVIPFPVIFTGGINPLFWEPVVSIGAFDLPSYDFDLTPFLGLLLDEKVHMFGLGVVDGISFWLVDTNLHLWLDHGCSSEVQARTVDYQIPAVSIEHHSVFKGLDGSFKIEAKRKSHFVGWVNSTAGNLTTIFLQEVRFKNMIKFHKNGTEKRVHQRVNLQAETRVESDAGDLISRATLKRTYPLRILTMNLPESENNSYVMRTNIVHGLKEKSSCDDHSSYLHNKQNSSGWMLVKDHDVLSGAAETQQTYDYKDDIGCYTRIVSAVNSKLVVDNVSYSCASAF